MVHQFKDFVGDQPSCQLESECRSSLAPTTSTIYLQIYNQVTSEWETVDSDNTTGADTDFILKVDIADLTNYKTSSKTISCRVYQEAI